MERKPCYSCKDAGRGSWCQVCKPRRDWFGEEIPDGRTGTWVQTYTGRDFWPLAVKPDDIHIMDIAVGESRECRYGKQTLRFYSVAEHSVIVSRLVGVAARAAGLDEATAIALEREGLLHDSDEGYLPDMPRPMKYDPAFNFAPFVAAGRAIQAAVFERFGVSSTPASHAAIDAIDKRLVVDETRQFMRHPERYLKRHPDLKPTGVMIDGLDPDDALITFLARFSELWPSESIL